jgi:hypothetical protein
MSEDGDRDALPAGSPAAPPPGGRSGRWARLGGAVLVGATAVVLAGVLAVGRHHPPTPSTAGRPDTRPPDPRLTYTGPFRNVHPDVPSVGDARCANCHPEISQSFARHPMGRSLTPVGNEPNEVYGAAHNNPFPALGSLFSVERHDRGVWHRQTRRDATGRAIWSLEYEAHYAIGSGQHGASYLTNRDGYLFQSPISWYAKKQAWDLSPDFATAILPWRPVGGACLYCHANRARFRENSQNHFDAPLFDGHAIGCERCHGPGGRHADSSRPEDIVDPRRLEPLLRDAVCEQCHLAGEVRFLRRGRGLYDFRPGLPLEQFWAIYVSESAPGERRKAVTHTEQMHESRCYQASRGAKKLGCTSCHDPHVQPEPGERVAFYRGRCLACHQDPGPGCSLPAPVRLRQRPDDSCIACHMPLFGPADVAHTAATNHSVPRRPPDPVPARDDGLGPMLLPPLAPFHPRPENDPDRARDLGVALVTRAREKGFLPAADLPFILDLLEAGLRNDPADGTAWKARGQVLLLARRPAEALAAFQAALRGDPEREDALVGAARSAQESERPAETLSYWRKVVAANPSLAIYRQNLTEILLFTGEWEEARRQCLAWRELDPASVAAGKAWIRILLHEGRKEEAAQEFARLEALGPPDLGQLRAWFQGQ